MGIENRKDVVVAASDGRLIGRMKLWTIRNNPWESVITFKGWSNDAMSLQRAAGSGEVFEVMVGSEGCEWDYSFRGILTNSMTRAPESPHRPNGPRMDLVFSVVEDRTPRRSAIINPDDILRAAYEPSIMNQLRAKHPSQTTTKEHTMERELNKGKLRTSLEEKQRELQEAEEAYRAAVRDVLASDETLDAWMDDYSSLVSHVAEKVREHSDGAGGRVRADRIKHIEQTLRLIDLTEGDTIVLTEDRINNLLK